MLLSTLKKFALVSILQKAITFTLNQIIYRNSNPIILGKATVEFELFLNSMLFLSREGIRLIVLRSNNNSKDIQSIINLSWLPFLVLLLLLFLIIFSHKNLGDDFIIIVSYNISAIIESIGEPLYNYCGINGQAYIRIYAEAIALTTRALSTYTFVVYLNYGVAGFSFAQIIYGLTYSISLYFLFYVKNLSSTPVKSKISISLMCMPKFIHQSDNKFDLYESLGGKYLSLAFTMTGTIFFKHLTTEADKIVLSILASNYDQGIYSVINNYCSLIARLVFYPIEETIRLSFPSFLNKITNTNSYKSDQNSQNDIILNLNGMFSLFFGLFQIMAVLSTLFPLFGPFYAKTFVYLFLGEKWFSDEVFSLISVFCVYLFIMGLNGITEAFIQSFIVKEHMKYMNINLFISTILFSLSASVLISKFRTCGLVASLTISMTSRLLFNLFYLYKSYTFPNIYFDLPHLKGNVSCEFNNLIPIDISFSILFIFLLLRNSSIYLETIFEDSSNSHKNKIIQHFQHIIVGVFCLLVYFYHLYIRKHSKILAFFDILRNPYSSHLNSKEN